MNSPSVSVHEYVCVSIYVCIGVCALINVCVQTSVFICVIVFTYDCVGMCMHFYERRVSVCKCVYTIELSLDFLCPYQ